MGKLFARMEPTSVAWDGFGHLGAGRDFVFRLLRGALEHREKGVNILLHGKPGTGKTEFCKALSEKLGASLHAVGEEDDDVDEPSRFERLQQLRLGQRLLRDQGNSIILLDEMEDMLPGIDNGLFGLSLRRTGSKVHMNRLFENNPVPTLWTTNDISNCDPALLRRISFTLELRTPPVSVRSQIWEKLAAKQQVHLPKEFCRELAHSMEDAPALANSALRAARIACGGMGSRDGAIHRWEISQVNEMLTWMENHPLPFACTTNLVDQLDPATARRFSLKIAFLQLNPEQRRACFRQFFKLEPPNGLQDLDQLTPGDFAVVAKRSNLLSITEPEAIIAELHREQLSKPDMRNPIGFQAAS